ncbi:unnamed protein product [Closterium sp. NIES-64]|nr:unnamed protein product [Closterium sp. NIES-64]
MDYYLLTIDGLVALDLRLRVAHPKLQTPSDAEVHLNVGIAELEHTDDIHGVLGQTYREDHAQRAADFQRLIATLNHPIITDGAEGEGFLDSTPRSYEASRVHAVDCAYTAFDRAQYVMPVSRHQLQWVHSKAAPKAPQQRRRGEEGIAEAHSPSAIPLPLLCFSVPFPPSPSFPPLSPHFPHVPPSSPHPPSPPLLPFPPPSPPGAMDSFRGGSKGATAAVAAAAERRGSLRQCKARSLFPPPCSLSLPPVPLPSSLFPFPPLLLRAMDSFKGGSKGATAVAAAAERRGSLRQRKVAADVVAVMLDEGTRKRAAAARLEALESDYTGVDAAVDEDDDVFNAEEELVQEGMLIASNGQ